MLIDAILGVGLAVLVLLLGFGLAPVGIVALVVLVVCAISYGVAWRRRVRS
jgi:hypothetical protein